MPRLAAGLVLVAVRTCAAEQCSNAGLSCCKQAPQHCPDADAPKKCRDEQQAGIVNGPGCRSDYIYSHCVNGKQVSCIYTHGCQCGTGQKLQKLLPSNASHSERCSRAGESCCAEASAKCPHPESGAMCMDEIHNGISNGLQCRNNYINMHCVAGRKYTCLSQQQCDCSSLRRPSPPKVQKQQQHTFANKGMMRQANANRQCNAAGRNCCRKAAKRCPYPNSGEACLSEIHAGVQQGPNCRENYIHSHCMADGMFSCNSQHHCDCFLQEEDGSIEKLYAISAGPASNFHLPQTIGHSTTAAGATLASVALTVATFSLLAALVTWSVRRRPSANFRTLIDQSLSTESEDDMSM